MAYGSPRHRSRDICALAYACVAGGSASHSLAPAYELDTYGSPLGTQQAFKCLNVLELTWCGEWVVELGMSNTRYL